MYIQVFGEYNEYTLSTAFDISSTVTLKVVIVFLLQM